jgi:hypothetical protein
MRLLALLPIGFACLLSGVAGVRAAEGERVTTLVAHFSSGDPLRLSLPVADGPALVRALGRIQSEAAHRQTVGAVEIRAGCMARSQLLSRQLVQTGMKAALGGGGNILWSRLVVAMPGSLPTPEGPDLGRFLAAGHYEPGTVVIGEDLATGAGPCS